MTPAFALITEHRPDDGLIGDCFRACIASLLDEPTNAVPHFTAPYGRLVSAEQSVANARRWLLSRHGLNYIEFPVGDSSWTLHQILQWADIVLGNGVHWKLLGQSRSDLPHCVVCRGGQIVHDPTYGDPHGIVGPAQNEDGDRYFWVALLVRG